MGKNIIMCFDGTSENFGPDPFTNVLKIYRLIDTNSQLCYYQPGIGSSRDFDSVNTWSRYLSWSRLKNLLDSMFAFCLDDHIVSAYLFLMTHYEVNDQIYMFGFSRGAFIARVLAGMLERVGLLNVGLDDMVHMAWKIYENWEFAEQPLQPNYATTLIQEFTKTFCRDYQIKIHFQGLFDSVNSVGLFRDRLFPCTQRSNIVNHVRHALSIDERRGKFKQFCFTPNPYEPTLFGLQYRPYEKEIIKTTSILKEYNNENHQNKSSENNSVKVQRTNPLIEFTLRQSRVASSLTSLKSDTSQEDLLSPFSEQTNLINEINSFLSQNELFSSTTRNIECSDKYIEGSFHINENFDMVESFTSSMKLWTIENNNSSHSTISPDIIEKWFPGDHSDVGGGVFTTANGQDISNLSLRWMIGEALKHGVKFKPGSINEFNEIYTSVGSLFSCVHDFLNLKKSGVINGRVSFNSNSNSDSNSINARELIEVPMIEPIFNGHNCRDEQDRQDCEKISKYVSIFWWLLEFLPIGIRIEDKDGKWRNRYVPNMGRSRCIPEYGQLHWSIIWLIKHDDEYRPKNLPRYVRDVLYDRLNVELPSIKTLDTLTLDENAKRRELYKSINQWIEENWENVPDDLFDLIKDDPTL